MSVADFSCLHPPLRYLSFAICYFLFRVICFPSDAHSIDLMLEFHRSDTDVVIYEGLRDLSISLAHGVLYPEWDTCMEYLLYSIICTRSIWSIPCIVDVDYACINSVYFGQSRILAYNICCTVFYTHTKYMQVYLVAPIALLFYVHFCSDQFNFSAQLIGGFTLSDLLDKPWPQGSPLLPPCTYLQLLSRIGFSIPTARRLSSNVANSSSRAFR